MIFIQVMWARYSENRHGLHGLMFFALVIAYKLNVAQDFYVNKLFLSTITNNDPIGILK